MKIICVGRNYAEHAAELGDDAARRRRCSSASSTNTLIGPGEPIVLPPEATHVDAEAELAVEIGARRPPDRRGATRSTTSAVTAARTTCRRATSSTPRASGRARRASTRSARSATELRPGVGARRRQRAARRPAAERRGAAGRQHARPDLPGAVPRRLHLGDVHARAGRPDPDRARRRASAGRATRRSRSRPATSSRSRSRESACSRILSSPSRPRVHEPPGYACPFCRLARRRGDGAKPSGRRRLARRAHDGVRLAEVVAGQPGCRDRHPERARGEPLRDRRRPAGRGLRDGEASRAGDADGVRVRGNVDAAAQRAGGPAGRVALPRPRLPALGPATKLYSFGKPSPASAAPANARLAAQFRPRSADRSDRGRHMRRRRNG